MARRGVRRLDDGRFQLTITEREHAALRSLPGQLEPLVRGQADTPAAHQALRRLYPPAADDPEINEAYARLVGDSLVEARTDALATFARTLAGGRSARGRWTVTLDDEQASAWLQVVNDTRLVLASIVGITTEADWERGPDPDDPASTMLWYLGWLEEEFVGALMGSLPDDSAAQ